LYGEKAKEIIMAWVKTYKSDGNTIMKTSLILFSGDIMSLDLISAKRSRRRLKNGSWK
jgi:hypothetical protein